MVRETRHLWVGNLPENIREDRIRDHFKRYGRVQSVKLLPRGEECPVDGGSSSSLGEGNEGGSGSNSGGGGGGSSSTSGGASATVAFMDIKSAAKAHAIEHTLDERTLTTQYYEPQHLQPRFASHGSSEDHGSSGGSGGGGGGTGGVSGGSGGGSGSTGAGVGGSGTGERGERGSESFDSRGSHGSFYGSERNSRVVGGSSGVVVGSGVGVGGHSADPATGDPGGYISRGRPPASSYHVTSSRARDRYARSGPYITGPPPPPPHLDRHRGSLPPSSWSAYEPTGSRYGGAPPPPSPATNDAYQDEQGVVGGGGSGSSSTLRQHKKQRRKSRSGSSSPSGSSRSGSSSSSRSGSSGGSSSGSTSPGSPVSPHRTSNVAVAEDRRPLAICVRNLPIRSSDTSLKDGLFHEYKKHGKVTWVKVVGSGDDRYALVCFKKPEDVEKALEVSQDKLFFGCKIEVAPYQGYDVEDNEFRPYEAELDEYHPKATRTLFIGNLEKDVTASELRKHFEPFGEIIEIDIKKQGAVSSYAFCQYSDIGSVVKAMRSMDGEHLGANRIKLGFGKSMPTACVWVDGIGDGMSEKYLNMQFHQFGSINQVAVDRERGHALVFFDQISCAQTAVKEMRGAALRGRRLQVDFASRECQETFYEHLERQGNSTEKTWESRPSPASSFDVTRERGSFDSAVTVSSSSSRFTRYDTPPRSRTASYSRTSGGSTPGASPAHPTAMSRNSRRSYQDSYYDGDYGEPTPRRFRSYDEFSQGSGTSHDDYQSSVLSDGKLNDDECPPPSRRHTVQSVVTSVDPPAPPPPLLPPPDIRHLQKERVHLLEQLEECQSSGDEVGFVPKKRAKLDSSSTTILCEDDEPEIASLLVTSHSNRKGMEFRRVSDSKVVVHHGTRRSSCEGRGPAPCKRRRDATSRHHEHHDGSRPGTPLVDERPENLVPSEPRRFRERSHEGPLSLPLPRFAAQMLNNNNNNSSSNNNNGSSTRLSSASLSKVASPPCASLSTAPSPRAAPQPPASPPPRHTSSSPTSSDSETVPQSPTLEERIRCLDEMYEKWSGSRALSAASSDVLTKLDAIVSERFRFPHKLLENDYKGVEPSEIMKSVLAKRSVFEEDSKRLENFSEKYEPREFTGVSSMIGSTAGLTTSGSCTGKVCLQYPFPSHPPVQSTSSTSVSSQVGINTSLSANLIPTTTMAPSMLKTDPRMVHICMHPTPATPITPGTSVKTVSPELPPVSLPIGLGSGTVASSGNGSGLASTSSLLNSNGSVSNIHTFGASTHRGLNVLATVTAASTNTFSTAIITTAISITTLSATTSSATTTTTTMCATGTLSSMTTTVCSVATASSIPSSSNSSSLSSSSQSSTELPRSRLKKESSSGNRESRDSRDGKDSSRESKHNKGKDCQRRSSRKEEVDVERNRKDRDEREGTNLTNDIGNIDIHNRDFKDNKELRYERKERDKEDRDRQERKDKEDRERQEKKERDEREKREKDEEKRERERLDKERQEKDRKEREEREKERERERERKEKEEIEFKEKERREKERIDREKREREEKERQERKEREERERKEREERERKEREIRLEREKQEKERLRREREDQERRDKEERERLERERRREEKERLERERKREREEKEKMERERRKEKEEREKAEKEKCEKEERERLEKEKHEKRREREDQERREKEKTEREKRRDREEKEKEKKEREDSRRQSTENHLHSSVTQSQTQVVPAPVPVKRRCSSQDGPTDEEAKRMKISDHRRDSKDRSRQNRRSEDRKHRNDSHRSSRESRENRDNKDSGNVIQDSRDNTHSESTRENNSRDNGNKEKQRSKRNRSEKSRERSPRVSHESDKDYLSKLELSKRNDSNLSTESASNHTRDVQHHQQQHSTLNSHSDIDDGPLSTHEMQVTRNPSATDTDSDEPKKHSIFDIVDDEPAYISMYDKVKARSTKNMQKLEEEKRQVRLKDKFSQLKQSRARREEKKQSTSWDGDSVSSKALTEDEATSESDSTRTKSLSRKGSRSRIHSDTSEEEEPFNNKVRKPVKADRFIESDVDFNFADTDEKQNSLETSNSVVVNSVHANIKEEPRTSDEDERVSVGFRTNHSTIVNNHERDSRKKSHKKKQKRQKSSMSNENNLKIEPTETLEHKTKTNAITSNADCRPNHGTELNTINTSTNIVTILDNAEEERMRVDKKQRSKKDKRRDRNGEDKAKARRKRLNRQEARDSQRMEDIFGPLSDDVDDAPSNTFFNRFGNITAENNVYASDSDGGRSSLDMDRVRRKTEKKRRHQLEDENSVDLAEAGREIEAKLLGIPSSPKSAPACTEPSDHDVFRFTDDNDSIEPSTPSTVPEKVKEKKKKRKKSKEERSRKDYHHHHHHHHHHHEKSGELPYLGAEPSPPRSSSPLVLSKTIISPSLPTPRETLLSPIPKVTSSISAVTSITPPVVSNAIQASKPEKKKDKFIPGFGIEMDETIHENAVKSISEPNERDSSCQQSRSGREEPELPVQTPPTQISPDGEDKPRVAISQEETEDAVAALLEETFGASTEDFSYEGEEEEAEADGVAETPAEAPQEDVEEMQQAVESLNASTGEGDTDMKPDTPQSEHDLQIDTDTEEDPNYETVDLTQPPKTPDIPSFYKSPTKTLNMTPVLTTPEKPVEVRLSPPPVTKSQTPPTSVIAHSWTLSENNKSRESVKSTAQLETSDTDADCVTSPERTAQVERASASPPPSQYKPMLLPCNVPITSEAPKSLPSSPRPPPITVQPLYQRLSVSPQSQMVPMRQASPKLQNPTTVSCSSSTNTTPLPPLVSSRIPSLVMSSQSSPRVTQPLSPNGQWSRNGPTLVSPHVPNIGKRKSSPPPTKIAVCMPIPAHSARPETPVQQVYSTAATQQPVIQHASGMLAPVPGYPRGGLPPLTLNIPPRPYMPVPPLASGVQVKNSRDSSLCGKSVIETLLPVNQNELPQRLEESKLSPAVIPETTHKASTSPKVPSPNQPPTYPPETAKITANMSSPIFNKPYLTDYTMSSTMSSRQKHALTIAADDRLSPPQKLENVGQLLTTHVSRASTSPVIMTVAHGQSHLLHKSVHNLGPSPVSSPNQPLVKTVVPVVPQQVTPTVPSSMPSDKCVITQTSLACQRQSPVSQSQLVKSHVPLISTVSQSPIITRVVPSTVSSVSTSSMNEQASTECLKSHVIQEQPLELDAEAQISQTVQPMLLTPPIQTTQPIDEIKQEPVEVKKEDTMEEPEYNIAESKKPLNQTCVDDVKPKQELQDIIKMEGLPSVPKVEADDIVVPKLEAETVIKLELENEIKEENAIKENDDVELDEQPVEDPLKEPSTDPLAIDSKDDPTDSKEDSDYWSAKEVNIESVIKKVDALCDGNDGDEEVQQNESVNSDSHDTGKNESDWFDAESAESEIKKSFVSTDDHDESAETCENEVTRSRRGRAKSRRGGRGGVTTRRGRNASNVSHKRGGRSPRGSKHHIEKSKLPADVYEFHDDSEEDNAGRPRLILTIKSPGPNVTGSNAQPTTPVAAVKEVPPEEFVSPAANTRKSRRLAERDGSRNTVDDVIEDVVRGSPANKGLVSNAGNVHATRRSTRHNNTPRNATQPPVVQLLTELRKSTRGSRKATRRISENNDDSGEEKSKEVPATQQETKPSSPHKEEPKLTQVESPKAEEQPAQVVASAPQKAISLEPMTLIDPVTGMLIPMRESEEEGQYIPVSTTSGQAQNTNKTLSELRNDRGSVSTNSTSEAPRVKTESSPSSTPAEIKKEIVAEQLPCPPTQQIQPQTSVITKSQSPAIQVTSTITVAQSSAQSTPTSVVTTVIPTTAVQGVPISSSQTKPTSLKAHVLNASKLATSTQQQQVAVTKPMPPSLPNQTIVQNIVKPPVQHVQSVQALNLQIPPGRVSSPSLSPLSSKQTVQLSSSNGKQGQPMSPVLNNTGVPPNPKQHLLQAAKQQTTTIVNMSQKIPINLHSNVNAISPSSRIHQPVSQPTALKGINGQPQPLNPKAHLLQAVVPPLITGTVTSSPSQSHLVNPQPISTGVSNVRPPGPKPPVTNTMEPQKVELPISGCIMPTTSPQARSVPMPTFEAPLHGTGATPPGGQYGLVPPHRSQSPPLPPPAHHHVNTSQSEVVNHYGGLNRGELPPHYLHSQMLQYSQYLRAQQEALTAPRIAYHIPGTRSPHLPLDPKLETGLEDTHSPPLELRRGTRTPQDRTTDSPQVAQVYMLGGVRLPPPQYNAGSNPSLPGAPVGARASYYEPPPAHLRSQYPMPASEAPPEMGRATTPERCRKHQVVTPPPYASQVPPQADTFQMLLQRYPVMWQGLLALKNDQAAVQMHFVFGNPNVARDSLPCNSDGSTPPLRIAQRMRLEQTQVEGVARKMQTDNEHCMLLALPCGRDEVDVLQQSKNLQTGFIMYLQQKQAAGIVNIAVPGSQQPAYVVHIFPSCDFAHENLARIAPDLLHRVAKIAHLLIVIATV